MTRNHTVTNRVRLIIFAAAAVGAAACAPFHKGQSPPPAYLYFTNESLDYARHLWMEREIKSVANVTRADVREMLAEAALMRLKPSVEEMPLSEANTALARVARGEGVRGALVLRVGGLESGAGSR